MAEFYSLAFVLWGTVLLRVATQSKIGLPMSSNWKDSLPVEPQDGQTRYRTRLEPRVNVLRVRIRPTWHDVHRSPLLTVPPAVPSGFRCR